MVVVGDKVIVPGAVTLPPPVGAGLSKIIWSAFVTAPQLNVTDCPTLMVVAEAVKELMLGCPEQAAPPPPVTVIVTCFMAV